MIYDVEGGGGDCDDVEGAEVVIMILKVMRYLWWCWRWRIGDYDVKGDEEMTDNWRWWEDDYGNVEGDEKVIVLVLKVIEVIMILKVKRWSWSCWRGGDCDDVEGEGDMMMKRWW